MAVKIEEFLPDRLTIKTSFSRQKQNGWVSPDGLQGHVSLKNLFGSPAANNRITAKLTLSPGRFNFKAYKSYRFTTSHETGKHYTESLDEIKTDKEGKVKFDLGLERFKDATYMVSFNANGYEKEGGRFVAAYSNILVSPLKFLIGTKANGNLNYIQRNSERDIEIIAINSDLKQVKANTLTFDLSRIKICFNPDEKK